eukprot:scaffold92149_cov29-Phaeocystis_antarctica.AAC.1
MGSHTRLVPGAVRLGATSKAFRAAPPGCQARLLHWIKVAEAKGNGLSPFESLLKPCWAVGACSPLLLTLDKLHFGRA